VEPGGQEGLILGLGDLAPHHLQVHLLDPQGESIAAAFEGFTDADDVAEELPLFTEVPAEYPVGQAAEQCDQATSGPTAGILGMEGIREGPVLVEVVEGAPAPGLLASRGGVRLAGGQRLPSEDLVFFLETLEKLFRVEPRFSHDVALLSLLVRVAFTGRSDIVAVCRRWFTRDGMRSCHPIDPRIVPAISGLTL
jgi:hypothetical protein